MCPDDKNKTAAIEAAAVLNSVVLDADWRRVERDIIARLRSEGGALVNTDEGGTGRAGGYRWSAGLVEKMRRAKVGRSLGGSSAFHGVSIHRATGRWREQLCSVSLGHYDTEQEAFLTYRDAYREQFGGDPSLWESWVPTDPADASIAQIGEANPAPKGI